VATLILSPEAAADLEEIAEYIASENVDAAIRVLAEIRQGMDRLKDAPEIGHSREDLTSEPLRFWPVRRYLIIYRASPEAVEVSRVLHGARDVEAILSGL